MNFSHGPPKFEFPCSDLYREGHLQKEDFMTVKETVQALLDQLPDDCSLDEIQYHLYVVQSVNRGLADANAGRTIPHEQVDAELRRKWLLGRAA